jgi:cytochrome c-type biogenesis protein CcmH/NrfG
MSASNEFLQAGIRAHSTGRVQEAAELYRHVLQYDPNNPVALTNLGLLLQQTRDYEQSEALLRQAIAQAPGNVDAYINLSLVLLDRGKYDDAIASCEHSLRLSPENKKVLNTLATCFTRAERYDEAIALLAKMVTAHPRYGLGHFFLGELYGKQKKWAEAAAHFKRAGEINSRDINAALGAGEAFLKLGDAAQAVAQFDKVLKLKTWDVNALSLKTLALAELGRVEDEKWLSDPEHFVHVHRIAEMGHTPGQVAELNQGLIEFAAKDPDMRKDPPEYTTYNGWHSTTNLADYRDSAIDKLKDFIAWGFEQRLKNLAKEDRNHPFVRSAPKKFRLDLWAVRTKGGGKMFPHVHPAGWLSASYYVDVPPVVDDPQGGKAGWIQFGPPQRGIALTREPLMRAVKPEPGLMVTFPSYLWHDTVPLPAETTAQRLVFAFDFQPL